MLLHRIVTPKSRTLHNCETIPALSKHNQVKVRNPYKYTIPKICIQSDIHILRKRKDNREHAIKPLNLDVHTVKRRGSARKPNNSRNAQLLSEGNAQVCAGNVQSDRAVKAPFKPFMPSRSRRTSIRMPGLEPLCSRARSQSDRRIFQSAPTLKADRGSGRW
jgi:hypothetical protein